MARLCIYHAGCYDGFCAAWLWYIAYPDSEFHAAHYKTSPPDCTGKDVVIADFSYPREVMRTILSQAKSVVVLDHHRSAEQELRGLVDEFTSMPDLIPHDENANLPDIRFDMTKSGGRLMWEYLQVSHPEHCSYFFGRTFSPWIVDYTEDRDLWKWEYPNSREVNAALRSYPMTFEQWDKFEDIRNIIDFLSREGAAILRRERQIIDQHVQFAGKVVLDSYVVPCVNVTVLTSDIVGELSKGQAFAAGYFDQADGARVWSLRSEKDVGVDVSEIAKTFGGGGHKHAAGFKTEQGFFPKA